MITKEEIDKNINTEWKLTPAFQKDSRYGICRFIIDIIQKLKLPKEIASLAMLLTNYFFIKKSYFNYDKLTLACAAILLSSKTRTSSTQIFDNLCSEYSIIYNKIHKEDRNNQRLMECPQDINKIKEQIGSYELMLLKQFNYFLPDEFPFDYIHVYSSILYPNNEEEMANFSIKIACDSYFTFVNNLYKSHIVALSCLIIAAKFLSIPSLLDENFPYLNKMKIVNLKNISEDKFIKLLFQFNDEPFTLIEESKNKKNEEEENEYFDNLTLSEKLYPGLQMNELLDCVSMIIDYYEDMDQQNENIEIQQKK